ncbi:MAG: YheT family hydrolase [Pirellulaceae bacterium]
MGNLPHGPRPLDPEWPRPFQPHILLRSGHAQTAYAGLWNTCRVPHAAQAHLLATEDGDQLVLHEDTPAGWRPGQRSALLVHGLGGCHRSPYIVRTADKLNQHGVRTFRLDLRGCGAGERLATRPGHAGRSEDARLAVEFVQQTCPGSPIVLLGYSLGANVVLKMLGECGVAAPPCLVGVLAVAPPIDLLACSRNMSRLGMTPYNRWFVRCLNQQVRERRSFVPSLRQLDLPRPPRTLYEFDDWITAPLSGFRSAQDYYEQCSAATLLNAIRVPTTILAAEDDPIVPASMFRGAKWSAHVRVHVTRHGGHVGYFGRAGHDRDRHWLDWRAVEFVHGQPATPSRPA